MVSPAIHHHPGASSNALSQSLLNLYPNAHAPIAQTTSPTSSSTVESSSKSAAPSPTFSHTSSLYRSALPELAPTPGHEPDKAFVQLLTLSSQPDVTFATSSFPSNSAHPNTASNAGDEEIGSDKQHEKNGCTVKLQAGEQTRSYVMLLSTKLGSLWTVARGWDVSVTGRRWIVTVPLLASDDSITQEQNINVEVEVGIGAVALRGDAGNTREGQRGAIIWGLTVDPAPNSKEDSPNRNQLDETARQVVQEIMADVGLQSGWKTFDAKDGEEIGSWGRVLRSNAVGQIAMARTLSRPKN